MKIPPESLKNIVNPQESLENTINTMGSEIPPPCRLRFHESPKKFLKFVGSNGLMMSHSKLYAFKNAKDVHKRLQ